MKTATLEPRSGGGTVRRRYAASICADAIARWADAHGYSPLPLRGGYDKRDACRLIRLDHWQLPDGSRFDGFAPFGAGDCGETECEAGEIVAGAVRRLAVFGDCGEELGHRAVEAVGEPRAFEPGPGDAVGRCHFDALVFGAGTDAANRALVPTTNVRSM